MEPVTTAIEVTESSHWGLINACARDKQGRILLGWYRVTRRRAEGPRPTFIRLRFDAGPFLSREDALA